MDIRRIGGTTRYSDIVIHNHVAYLSGIVPIDLSNNIIGQTQEVLNTLDTLLASIYSSKEHILSMTIYLKDASLYQEMNVAYDRWVTSPPARATIGIVTFPNPRWLIEIVVTASISPYPMCSYYSYDISNNYISTSSNYLSTISTLPSTNTVFISECLGNSLVNNVNYII